jgi:cytochrome c oxidase subunit 2
LVAESVVVRTETRWLFIMAGMLGIMLAVLVLTGVFQALHPLSHIETVDPATLHLAGEFVESNLGSAVEPDGVVTVRMIAHQYMFTPQCVTVPAGTLVRFRLTSPDVTHGFIIADTNANAMIVPGFVSEITTRFDRIGEYEMPCHEYCGFGHHGMWARVVVVPRDHFPTLRPDERMTCVPR